MYERVQPREVYAAHIEPCLEISVSIGCCLTCNCLFANDTLSKLIRCVLSVASRHRLYDTHAICSIPITIRRGRLFLHSQTTRYCIIFVS